MDLFTYPCWDYMLGGGGGAGVARESPYQDNTVARPSNLDKVIPVWQRFYIETPPYPPVPIATYGIWLIHN